MYDIMKRKILAIDYLRGLSILSLVLLHIILPMNKMPPTEYSSLPILFTIRDVLNVCVVTLIACSGFSLYLSAADLTYTSRDIFSFYRKRLKRVLLPWFNYVIISYVVYGAVRLFYPALMDRLVEMFPFFAIGSYGGIPIVWIALKWIVLLLIMLTFLFPLLKYIYENKPWIILVLVACYLASSVLLVVYPADFMLMREFRWPWLHTLLVSTSFVLGWSLVYIFGFSLDKLYHGTRFMQKDMKVTFVALFVFVAIYIAYKSIGLDTLIHSNRLNSSPYYFSLGVAATLMLLSLFVSFDAFFRAFPKKILEFVSSNSYWLYLWSLLVLFFMRYAFSLFDLGLYVKLLLEFFANCAVLYLIVRIQRMIKIDIYIERQNF